MRQSMPLPRHRESSVYSRSISGDGKDMEEVTRSASTGTVKTSPLGDVSILSGSVWSKGTEAHVEKKAIPGHVMLW